MNFLNPVQQNFWNGILTINFYIVKANLWKIPCLFPRINLASRFTYNRWFQFGMGWLFDRGEFGFKFIFSEWNAQEKWNPGVNAKGWEEGSI